MFCISFLHLNIDYAVLPTSETIVRIKESILSK